MRLTAATDQDFAEPQTRSGIGTPLQVAMQRKLGILVFAVLVTALVGLVLTQLHMRYTATASVMVDTRQMRVGGGESVLPSQIVDGDLLRTRMEALKSPHLVREVVEQLGLTTMPEFCTESSSWIEAVGDIADRLLAPGSGAPAPAQCSASVEQATRRLEAAMSYNNDGRSYVIHINAEARSPKLAAKIANTYANTFVNHEHQEWAGLTSQADAWLSTHLAELKAAVNAADVAVGRKRQDGQLTTLRGETILAQSLSELNSQLTTATGELTQKQSTLQQLLGVAGSSQDAIDASAPVLGSPIIQRLIEQEGTLAASQAQLSARFSNDYPWVRASAAQLAQVRRQLRTEVTKAINEFRGEVQALLARQATLQNSVRDLQAKFGQQGIANMTVQDLERDASSARNRYDAAATRLEQISIEAATQRADVQMLVEASPPIIPSFPRTRMVVAGTFMSALGVGVALAYALALLSRIFKDPEHVENVTGLSVIGLFAKPLSKRAKPQDITVDHPRSRQTEALHLLLANLIGGWRGRPGKVVLVTSAVPGEGKTSFCVALGRAATSRGLSVVVVDCDLRNSTIRNLLPALEQLNQASSMTGEEPSGGLRQSFERPELDRVSGLNIVVAPKSSLKVHADLGSVELLRSLEQLRDNADLVIIDTPPVLVVPDALGLAAFADQVILLAGWRQTPRSAVTAALQLLRRAQVQVSGIVLSKVDLRRLAKKRSSSGYYARTYGAYHSPGQT